MIIISGYIEDMNIVWANFALGSNSVRSEERRVGKECSS